MNFFQNFQSFLLIIILLFSFVNCQNIPNPRSQQTYSFNTATPPWNKDIGMPIGYVLGASCVSPIDNSVFLVGGRMYIPNTANNYLGSSPVYVFNSNISVWTTPNIIGYNSSFKMRNQIQPVIDNYGKVYIFGGTNYTGFNASSVGYNDMSILNTTSMIWSTLAIFTNAPPILLSYTATLLPTGILVYIGGFKVTLTGSVIPYEPVNMYEIQTFNTKNYSWSTKVVCGASIALNGDIIIYGGTMWNDTTIPSTPYIAKLNTSSWMWYIPNLSQINSPQLCFHSAAIYGDYMIIAFGQIPSKTSISFVSLSNTLYILDIKSYTWVTSFNPNQSNANQTFPPTTNQTPSPDNNLNNYLFIGIGIGAGIVLLGVFSVVGFLLYKRKRQS
ncbi:hypothetical protein C2G38_2117858 [Gigaspora rosea]|uniref:Attractin/MKLN-like beta-propeller domain-containing protein n=1 Tax=Gigaspora rosea TaxID=44941 RepID=A0A397U5W0_9GLOM|nr:hypothetical protein C2G38_2117858 [Gigaspora rosea]